MSGSLGILPTGTACPIRALLSLRYQDSAGGDAVDDHIGKVSTTVEHGDDDDLINAVVVDDAPRGFQQFLECDDAVPAKFRDDAPALRESVQGMCPRFQTVDHLVRIHHAVRGDELRDRQEITSRSRAPDDPVTLHPLALRSAVKRLRAAEKTSSWE